MWGQSWLNLYPLLKPYPDSSDLDITATLKEQNYTPLKMFEIANQFFTSLGFESTEMAYNEKGGGIIVKPNNSEIVCHGSSWDFSNKEDFRIKMCADVTYDDFQTIHHELGHIAYFISYKDQPFAFRRGANPGFHEAIGDTIALSATTLTHLKQLGLIKEYVPSEQNNINSLMLTALDLIAFLPFGLVVDKWRWDVFSGQIPQKQWNSRWWHYRKEFQKLKPPVERSNTVDFDPGAKMHVAADDQYIDYFVSHILQFQLYRGLCIAAKQYDPNDPKSKPLHTCDFYNSKEAGNKLRAGLSLGASKHWKEVLFEITGESDLDASALLEYFEPLHHYLENQNHVRAGTVEKPYQEEGLTIAQILPIVVGGVFGVVLVAGVAVYLIKRRN